MADFHRFVTPTYFGGLPGTHDLINVISGGIGSGDGSAPADGAKAGPHPNEGTYFVAFGEAATTSDVNRGMRALSQNTDYLDDVVHADQSLPAITASVTPVAPVASVAITGNVFVGDGTETNDQRTRSGLVVALDSNGIPLHVPVTGTFQPVLVTKIHDGLGASVLGSDYYVNPTVDFSPSIPTGQAYRLAYYTRGNLVTQSSKAYTRLASGVRGEEDLWAYAKTTRSGVVTFNGDKTFAEPVTFDDLVSFIQLDGVGVDATVPLLSTDVTGGDDSSNYKLIHSYKAKSGSPIRVRIYTYNSTAGLVITINASWDQGTISWIPDSTSSRAMKLSSTVQQPFYWESKEITLPASWTDIQWDGTSGGGNQLSSNIFRFGAHMTMESTSSSVPVLETLNAPQDDAANSWKLIFKFKSANADSVYIRVYAGNLIASGSRFCITANAEWSGTNWSSDEATIESVRIALKLGTVVSELAVGFRNPTGATWVDNQWETSSTFDTSGFSGTVSIGGEYRYANARTYILPLSGFQPVVETTGAWSYNILTGELKATSAPGSVMFAIPRIPHKMHLAGARVLVDANAIGTVSAILAKVVHDLDGPSVSTVSYLDNQACLTNALEVISLTALDSVDNEHNEYFILVSCNNANDKIYSVEYSIS
jgi:hypothetical protein